VDFYSLARVLGALALVLGLLVVALWVVRRFNISLPGSLASRQDKRLAVVEHLSIDAKRKLLLLRRDGREHLVLVSADGALLIEAGIEPGSRP
jgi:flagellar biogenesis protein FliO